jgi:hypothetical protein
MDGVFTQCSSRHPETGVGCVRLAGTHEEHVSDHARDVHCQRWTDPEEGK